MGASENEKSKGSRGGLSRELRALGGTDINAGEGGRSRRRSTRDEPLAKKELSGALAQPRREPRARAARASAAEGTVPDSPGPSGRSGRGSARPSGHEARVSRQSISITSTAESDRNSDPDTESDESDTITGLLLTRDDISEDLRSSWLFAGVTHFCNVFKSVLHLPKSTGADKLEGVMQCPDAHPVFLAKLHCAVVAPEPVRRVDESELSRWEERVKRAWGSAWREHIEEDIFHGKSYAELTPGERCALLYVLCEHRAANCPLLRDHMAAERRRSFSRVRQSAVSRPDSGYDSDLDSSLAPRSRGGASEDDGASGSGAGRCLSTTQMVIGEDSQRRQYLRLGDNECWVFRVDTRGPTRGKSGALSAEGRVEVVATSAAECTEMAEQMKRSGAEGELRKSLLDVVVPSLEALEAAVQRRLQHAALVEAAPGKRSGRLARVRQEAEEREREMREKREAMRRKREEEEEMRQTREREERLEARERERARRLQMEEEKRVKQEEERIARAAKREEERRERLRLENEPRELDFDNMPVMPTVKRPKRVLDDAGRCSPHAWHNSRVARAIHRGDDILYDPPAVDPFALPEDLRRLKGRMMAHALHGRGGLARGTFVRSTAVLLREAIERAEEAARAKEERARRAAEELAAGRDSQEHARTLRELRCMVPADVLKVQLGKKSRAERMREREVKERAEGGTGEARPSPAAVGAPGGSGVTLAGADMALGGRPLGENGGAPRAAHGLPKVRIKLGAFAMGGVSAGSRGVGAGGETGVPSAHVNSKAGGAADAADRGDAGGVAGGGGRQAACLPGEKEGYGNGANDAPGRAQEENRAEAPQGVVGCDPMGDVFGR